jgi:hypothetical protein
MDALITPVERLFYVSWIMANCDSSGRKDTQLGNRRASLNTDSGKLLTSGAFLFATGGELLPGIAGVRTGGANMAHFSRAHDAGIDLAI